MRVPYHISTAHGYYSLSHVDGDFEELQKYCPRHIYFTILPLQTTPPVYALYTKSGFAVEDGLNHELSLGKQTSSLIYAYLNIYKSISNSASLTKHKQFSLPAITSTLDNLEWKDSIETVGGILLSSLIQTHGLPNANHRSSLGFLFLYLHAKTGQDMSSYVPEDEWLKNRLDDYQIESKRLLTIRRNWLVFNDLFDVGVTEVERKGGIVIDLSTILFDEEVGRLYSDKHEQLSIRLVRDILERYSPENVGEIDTGKHAFHQWLCSR